MNDFLEYIKVEGKYHFDNGFDIPIIGPIFWFIIYRPIISIILLVWFIVTIPAMALLHGIEKATNTVFIRDDDVSNVVRLLIYIVMIPLGIITWGFILLVANLIKRIL